MTNLKFDLVVVQFGALDINIPVYEYIKKKILRKQKVSKVKKSAQPIKSEVPSGLNKKSLQRLRWFFKYLVKRVLVLLLRMRSTSVNDFTISMRKIISELSAQQVEIILVSPFKQVDVFTHLQIKAYGRALLNLQTEYDFIFVDGYRALDKENIEEIFGEDGMHLSIKGHQVVAEAILQSYCAHHS